MIIRVEYNVPASASKPEADYLHSFAMVDVSIDYLASRTANDDVVAPIVGKRMKGAFKKYLKDN